MDFEPYENGSPSFEICPHCGIQFGYTDMAGGNVTLREEIYKKWKEAWIQNDKKTLSEEQRQKVLQANKSK